MCGVENGLLDSCSVALVPKRTDEDSLALAWIAGRAFCVGFRYGHCVEHIRTLNPCRISMAWLLRGRGASEDFPAWGHLWTFKAKIADFRDCVLTQLMDDSGVVARVNATPGAMQSQIWETRKQ